MVTVSYPDELEPRDPSIVAHTVWSLPVCIAGRTPTAMAPTSVRSPNHLLVILIAV